MYPVFWITLQMYGMQVRAFRFAVLWRVRSNILLRLAGWGQVVGTGYPKIGGAWAIDYPKDVLAADGLWWSWIKEAWRKGYMIRHER